MGLFDFFQSEEQKITKRQRKITNRDAQPEDREAAARWLADQGSPAALLALLARFDVSLDHQLKDKGEKDLVYALASSKGNEMLAPLETWLKKCRSVALPLRLLKISPEKMRRSIWPAPCWTSNARVMILNLSKRRRC